MRFSLEGLTGVIVAIAVLAGCAGGQQGELSIPDSAMTGQSQSRFEPLSDPARPTTGVSIVRPPKRYKGKRDLYVVDIAASAVDLLTNKGYYPDGSISIASGSNGDFVDRVGNLYVASYTTPQITEYPPGVTSPSFTYNAGMVDPENVTVDNEGNVFEADHGATFPGFVAEYSQGQNTMTNQCFPGGAVEGIAEDKHGNVFVSYNGKIAEYTGGLSSCNPTVLSVDLLLAGGMAVDKHDNLIVCDKEGPTVDVIAPPYTMITRQLGSGFAEPSRVALSKNEKTVFVTDIANRNVEVIDYKTGAVITTLGSAQGLSQPTSATDGPNATF